MSISYVSFARFSFLFNFLSIFSFNFSNKVVLELMVHLC